MCAFFACFPHDYPRRISSESEAGNDTKERQKNLNCKSSQKVHKISHGRNNPERKLENLTADLRQRDGTGAWWAYGLRRFFLFMIHIFPLSPGFVYLGSSSILNLTFEFPPLVLTWFTWNLLLASHMHHLLAYQLLELLRDCGLCLFEISHIIVFPPQPFPPLLNLQRLNLLHAQI